MIYVAIHVANIDYHLWCSLFPAGSCVSPRPLAPSPATLPSHFALRFASKVAHRTVTADTPPAPPHPQVICDMLRTWKCKVRRQRDDQRDDQPLSDPPTYHLFVCANQPLHRQQADDSGPPVLRADLALPAYMHLHRHRQGATPTSATPPAPSAPLTARPASDINTDPDKPCMNLQAYAHAA